MVLAQRAAAHLDAAAPAEHPPADGSTRTKVLRVVSAQGPISAADIAAALQLTPAAVRRHVDALLEQGAIVEHEQRTAGPRGRGRPARSYVISPAGHQALDAGYDSLAAQALRFLAAEGGHDAVARFAHLRAAGLAERYAGHVESQLDPRSRTTALVAALTGDGYAATARPVALGPEGGLHGIQLCQGHCPVQHVAEEFPELCEAETEVFSKLIGAHVQRLATLAGGDHVCTTFVPLAAVSQAAASDTSDTSHTPDTSTSPTVPPSERPLP